MKVVLLCGGIGTRLREETEYRPKPTVPVGGRPILWHIMKLYAAAGHTDFVLCLGYKGESVRDYFRNYLWNTSDVTLKLGRNLQITYHTSRAEEDWTVTLLETGQETQTGGRLLRALPYLGNETFLFTYGDGVTDSDINASIRFNQSHGAIATGTAVKPRGRFGELAMNGKTVTTLREKPDEENAYISGGFMILDPRIRGHLGAGDRSVFERRPMECLAQEGQLRAYNHDGFWQCMDTFQEQQMLDRLWTEGNAPWRTW